jgi:hypothetical protein
MLYKSTSKFRSAISDATFDPADLRGLGQSYLSLINGKEKIKAGILNDTG